MRDLCKSYGILFIADEVITGFGRTGPLFACADEDIVPDMMTVAKGLTSGYVPMGAVFMADHVYDVIADGPATRPSATALPIPPIRSAPLSRWKCSNSTKAGCSKTALKPARVCRRVSKACVIILWSAMSVAAGCSMASNS